MVRSPNDMDPPDYVVGGLPEEALYETIYEKFPWLESVETTLAIDVDKMLEFVINESVKWGQDNAQSDMGEYMDHKIAELERQIIILRNQRDRMVQVNLGVEETPAPQTDEAWLEWEG
jgi:hypothetical protein